MRLWRNWMLLTWVLLPGCMSASDLTGPEAVSGFLGRSLSVICKYDVWFKKHKKYWCQGNQWSSCKIVVLTTGSERERMAGRIFIKDDQTRLEFTIRMENLTQQDAGTYWCAIEVTGSDYVFPVNITVLQASDGMINMSGISLRENKKEHYIQVTMDNLKLDDSGVYSCVIIRALFPNIKHSVNMTIFPDFSSDLEETTAISRHTEPDLFVTTTKQEQATKQSGFSPTPTEYLVYVLFPLKILILLCLGIAIIWMHRRYNQKRSSAASWQENAAH